MFPKVTNKKRSKFDDIAGPKDIDARFSNHQLVYFFMKELNLKEVEVYEMNYISSLNWLGFFKERDRAAKAANNNGGI